MIERQTFQHGLSPQSMVSISAQRLHLLKDLKSTAMCEIGVLSHLNSFKNSERTDVYGYMFFRNPKISHGKAINLIALAYFANSGVLPSPPSTLLLEWHQIWHSQHMSLLKT